MMPQKMIRKLAIIAEVNGLMLEMALSFYARESRVLRISVFFIQSNFNISHMIKRNFSL